MSAPIHATAVAHFSSGRWSALLLTGPSGAGKSDLALRLIGRGWRLVSDDYTRVWVSGKALFATAPRTISGRIEARGLGIIPMPALDFSRVVGVVDCVSEAVERLPEPAALDVCGVSLPRHRIDIRAPSAVELAIATIVAL